MGRKSKYLYKNHMREYSVITLTSTFTVYTRAWFPEGCHHCKAPGILAVVCSTWGSGGFTGSQPSDWAGATWILSLSSHAAFLSCYYCGSLLCDHVLGSALIPLAWVLSFGGRDVGSQSTVAGKHAFQVEARALSYPIAQVGSSTLEMN